MSKGKKIGIAVAAVFVVVIAVSAITYQIAPPASSATDAQQTVADEYTKTDASQSYVRDGEECMGYRVAVSATATEEQLLSVFTPKSPNFAASGISPAPQESRTIRKMRFILVFAPFCRDRNLRRERK